jgi:hypothetical protein
MLPAAAQWRETTPDAVYTQPDIPVPNAAGRPGAYTGNLMLSMLCHGLSLWDFPAILVNSVVHLQAARQYGVKFGS